MDESLLVVLKVILYLMVFFGCLGAVGSFVFLLWLNSHVIKLSQFVQGISDSFKDLSELITSTGKVNTDDILKLDTDNSQKIYDAQITQIQMLNKLMTGLGYNSQSSDDGIKSSPKEIA